jgi:hypothetical protein
VAHARRARERVGPDEARRLMATETEPSVRRGREGSMGRLEGDLALLSPDAGSSPSKISTTPASSTIS